MIHQLKVLEVNLRSTGYTDTSSLGGACYYTQHASTISASHHAFQRKASDEHRLSESRFSKNISSRYINSSQILESDTHSLCPAALNHATYTYISSRTVVPHADRAVRPRQSSHTLCPPRPSIDDHRRSPDAVRIATRGATTLSAQTSCGTSRARDGRLGRIIRAQACPTAGEVKAPYAALVSTSCSTYLNWFVRHAQ